MARGFPEMEKAVRKLAADAGCSLDELPVKNKCCGFGGHMRVANQNLYDAVVDDRVTADEAPYLVYCANCSETFALAGKEHVHILDLIFKMTEMTKEPSPCQMTKEPSPCHPLSLQQWRDNAAQTKALVMELYGSEPVEPSEKPWDLIRLDLPDALISDMDKRLILEDDLREAIYKAERNNDIFTQSNGLRQCRLIRDVVTTWVQYRINESNCYKVIDVWSHRMRYSDTE